MIRVPYALLMVAIVAEVIATLSLKLVSEGRRKWYLPVVLGYGTSFVLLAVTLRTGLDVGVVYGIWVALGVAITAVASRFLFGEPFTPLMATGVALIAAGVLLIEMGASA